jgi:hypothetical protein
MTRTPYWGRTITFATMHGKERLARQPFREVLGAIVTASPGLDTDQFGTFAGDIPRTLSPHAAARAKAHLGMRSAGTTLALASEGSFSPGLTQQVENVEILMFIDDDLGMEIVEAVVDTSPLPAGRRIHSAAEARQFATRVGFPHQGVIVSSAGSDRTAVYKNLSGLDELESTATALLAHQPPVLIQPDYRSHRAPSRAAVIGGLCTRMAARLATPCPQCQAPGFGQTGAEPGLPCSACGSATGVVADDVYGCARCPHRMRVPRVPAVADPRWCDYCNP